MRQSLRNPIDGKQGMHSNEVVFFLPGLPLTKSSNHQQRRAYQRRILHAFLGAALECGFAPVKKDEALEIHITSIFHSHHHPEGERYINGPDADNIAVLIMNALKRPHNKPQSSQKYLYNDDCIVSDLISRKRWSQERQGVEIRITRIPIPSLPSNNNRRTLNHTLITARAA